MQKALQTSPQISYLHLAIKKTFEDLSQFFCRMYSASPTTSFVPRRRYFSKATVTNSIPAHGVLSSATSPKKSGFTLVHDSEQTDHFIYGWRFRDHIKNAGKLQRTRNAGWSSKLLMIDFKVCSHMFCQYKSCHIVYFWLYKIADGSNIIICNVT